MTTTPVPLISVVIPSYMHGHLIGRALQSLLDQTYRNWEAIVVDNHSSDRTDDVVANAADPRIRLVKIRNNGIIAVSRNQGIHDARGTWIAFLDSDDWWTADKLQVCVENMREEIDLIHHDLKIWRDQPAFFSAKKIKSHQLSPNTLIDLLVNGNSIANSSVLVRKTVLEEMGGLCEHKALVACEDYDAWLKIASMGKKFYYIPKSLGFYYQNSQGVSQKDMSIPVMMAVSPYLKLLKKREINKLGCYINYMKGVYLFKEKKYKQSAQTIRATIFNSRSIYKVIKMIVILASCKINQIKLNGKND